MKNIELSYTKRWSGLDWDALVRYHSISKGEPSNTGGDDGVGELMERMQEFEVVSGMRIVGMGCSTLESEEPKTKSEKSELPVNYKDELEEKMKWLEKEIWSGGSCVWMKSRNDIATKEDIYVMPREEFVRVVREATAWLNTKEGLLKLPEKWIVIDGETFALPSFVGNDDRAVRYGQYGDMQMYMLGLMNLISKGEPSSAELEQLRMYRNGFLSTLLLPTMVEEIKVDDVNAKGGVRYETRRRVLRYDRNARERVAEKVDKAPSWLFSLLWHLTQSCLAYYHGRFPDLIDNKKSGKKNTDMYVAKLGTDNAVMKYAGYPCVDAVNDEPVGVILERLDAMAKESKEWERARRKRG